MLDYSVRVDPENPDMRISDAEREGVVARLDSAVSEGRLTLAEFEERIDGVFKSRTYGEIEPYVRDLPAGAIVHPVAARELVEIRTRASSHKRTGRWNVPRKLVINGKSASVKLDFVDAVCPYPAVEIDLDLVCGSTLLILPAGASAEVHEVESRSSTVRSSVPASHDAMASGIRFIVTSKLRSSTLKIRYRRRFWRWQS